ncbi:MAG: hypothetical protein AB7K63_07910 [Vicinamibacterales bacterium]
MAVASCAARSMAFPTDPGAPFADYAAVHAELSKACASVRTLTAELALSGRAGSQRMRGRVVSGFEQPASVRLEGVAPFGPPAFILASRGAGATLLLPRDNAVLRGEPFAEILGALTGVSLAPADLQAVLTGCVEAAPSATAGWTHGNGWVSIDLAGGSVVYLRRMAEAWQVAGARRDRWEIEYGDWQGTFPRQVRLRSTDPEVNVDLTAAVNQLETNVDIPPEAFGVNVPQDAIAITLDELRAAGPLRADD